MPGLDVDLRSKPLAATHRGRRALERYERNVLRRLERMNVGDEE